MKRPRSHVIDEEAMRVFRSALPAAWIIRDLQHPDYAKDYEVELRWTIVEVSSVGRYNLIFILDQSGNFDGATDGR